MKKIERDARLKLLILQGALYRSEIIAAKISLSEASKPFWMVKRWLRLLTFTLEHKQLALIGAVMLRLLGPGRSSGFVRRALMMLGSSVTVWWLIRRRSEF